MYLGVSLQQSQIQTFQPMASEASDKSQKFQNVPIQTKRWRLSFAFENNCTIRLHTHFVAILCSSYTGFLYKNKHCFYCTKSHLRGPNLGQNHTRLQNQRLAPAILKNLTTLSIVNKPFLRLHKMQSILQQDQVTLFGKTNFFQGWSELFPSLAKLTF